MSKKTKKLLKVIVLLAIIISTIMLPTKNYAVDQTQNSNDNTTPTFSIIPTEDKAKVGESSVIDLNLNEKLTIVSFRTEFLFDNSAIELVNVEKGEALSDSNATLNLLRDENENINGIEIKSSNSEEFFINEGTFAKIEFKVNEDAKGGMQKIAFLRPEFDFPGGENIDLKTEEGTLEIEKPLLGIELDKQRIEILYNSKIKVQYKLLPEDAYPVPKIEWITANKDVATVSEDGEITAVGVGKTTISAKVGDYVASIEVTVSPKPFFRIDRNELVVGEKETITMDPQDIGENFKITYSSSDDTIATVSDKGVIESIKPGRVRIGVYIDGNLENEFEIEILASNVPETGDISVEIFASLMIITLIGMMALTVKNKTK